MKCLFCYFFVVCGLVPCSSFLKGFDVNNPTFSKKNQIKIKNNHVIFKLFKSQDSSKRIKTARMVVDPRTWEIFVQAFKEHPWGNPLISSFMMFLFASGGRYVHDLYARDEVKWAEMRAAREAGLQDVDCPQCNNSLKVDCPECKGKGFYMVDTKDLPEPRSCKFCGASGQIPCAFCEDRQQQTNAMKIKRLPSSDAGSSKKDDLK